MCVYRGDGGYAIGHLPEEAVTINRAAHQRSQNNNLNTRPRSLGRRVAGSLPGSLPGSLAAWVAWIACETISR